MKLSIKILVVLFFLLCIGNIVFADTLQVTIPTVLSPTNIPVAPLTIYTPINTTSPPLYAGVAVEMMNGSTIQDILWTIPRYVVPIYAANSPTIQFIQQNTTGYGVYPVTITCGNQDLSGFYNLPTGSILFNGGTVCPTPTPTPLPVPTPTPTPSLNGVVTGPYTNNVFNSTNAAGNTMNNAFVVNNANGNNRNPYLTFAATPVTSLVMSPLGDGTTTTFSLAAGQATGIFIPTVACNNPAMTQPGCFYVYDAGDGTTSTGEILGDDGTQTGNLVSIAGPGGSGYVNYQTGAINVTVTTAPSSGSQMEPVYYESNNNIDIDIMPDPWNYSGGGIINLEGPCENSPISTAYPPCISTQPSLSVPSAAYDLLGYPILTSTSFSYFADSLAVGIGALYNSQTGAFNTAVGGLTLFNNTNGQGNTAVGYQVLYSNTTGAQNVAIGLESMYYNTTGDLNMGMGPGALYYNTTGSGNLALGFNAVSDNVNGNFNVGLGSAALTETTTGSNNTAVGYESGLQNQSGNNNIYLGSTYDDVQTGSNNILIGTDLQNTTDSSNQIDIGDTIQGTVGGPVTVGSIVDVGNLPLCDSGHIGQMVVDDAAGCTDGIAPSAGGYAHCPVFCAGLGSWLAMLTVPNATPLPTPTPTPGPG